MSTATISTVPTSAYCSYQLYDEENPFSQDCLISPSLGQQVADFDSLNYSAFQAPSYSASILMPSTSAPLSIYTNNLDNFSNLSLPSSTTSISPTYYSDIGFGQCGVEAQWNHIDDGYVSGGTSPITSNMPGDAFYPIQDQQLVLLDGTLSGLEMGAQMEPSLLDESASLGSAPDQLQYAMYDPVVENSPSMGLGIIDPLSADNYISSAESSPLLPSARSKSIGGSRSPSPSQQSFYSTFDNKGALMKCPHKDCSKAFGRVYNLKTHLKSHVSTKPWNCPMCPRSFTRKHDLQRHVRVHTGQKPYVCPCCHKRFARTDALTRHIRVEDSCRLSEEVANYKGRRRYSDLS